MISYDTNILIYAFESAGPWAQEARNVVEAGERKDAILSVLVWQEALSGAALRSPEAEEKLRFLLNQFVATKFEPVTQEIADRAVLLTQQHGRKLIGYDALLVATAIEHGAEAFFTNDKQLLELKLPEIPIRGLPTRG